MGGYDDGMFGMRNELCVFFFRSRDERFKLDGVML